MSPLPILLGCVTLAAAGSLYVQKTLSRGFGGELGLYEARGRALLCALQCERAGVVCVGFRMEGGSCRLLSGLTAGQSGTFVRGCGGRPIAYRAIIPMTRPQAVAECAADGGRMAIPLSGDERSCVQQVVDVAGATPDFLPDTIAYNFMGWVGLLAHGPPDYNITDLEGNAVTVPEDALQPNQPDDSEYAYMAFAHGQMFDYRIGAIIMNICEFPL